MNVKPEDVFLIVLKEQLRRDNLSTRTFGDSAEIAKDATAEIISVANKLSKSGQ